MKYQDSRESPAHYMRKDTLACSAVLTTMIITMACGALLVDAGTDPAPQYAAQYAQAAQVEAP